MLQIMETYRAREQEHLADRMGITVLEASAERVVGTMPVAGNTQPYGLLHGGASCVLAETLGSLGSALPRGPRQDHGRHRDQRPRTTARPRPAR